MTKSECPKCGECLTRMANVDSDDRINYIWLRCGNCRWDQRDEFRAAPPSDSPGSAHQPQGGDAWEAYPSMEAMKAAVELEIQAALGSVQTVAIGRMIQKVIDATPPAPARAAAAGFAGERSMILAESQLPLQYEDGPDYCTVTDNQGRPFAMTVQPDLLKAMEQALCEQIAILSRRPVDIVDRLRKMPSSLNDACRTMDEAADLIERIANNSALAEELREFTAATPDPIEKTEDDA